MKAAKGLQEPILIGGKHLREVLNTRGQELVHHDLHQLLTEATKPCENQ